jgi:hypothetical protein
MRGGWLCWGLALVVVGGACGNDLPVDLRELEVASAGLSNPEVSGGGVALGGMALHATLDVTDALGGAHRFPVVLSGPCLGITGFWSSELNARDDRDLLGVGLDLPEQGPSDDEVDGGVVLGDAGGARPLRLRHLFEEYKTLGFGVHAMLGAAIYYFSNDAEVVIWMGGLTTGLGVTWGAGSLRMALDE